MIRKMFSIVAVIALIATAALPLVMAQEGKGKQETASFKITKKSLEDLKSEGVPYEVLRKLQDLKDQEITGEDKFLGVLKTMIGNEQTDKFKSLILKHAGETPERPIELPEVVITGAGEVGCKTPPITSLTLIDTPSLELPLSYEVMNKQSLEEMGISRCIEAWEHTSGVRSSEAPLLFTATGGSSIVRGFRTETTINGFPVPKEVNLFLNSTGIERIEYFKGSAAAIQGANTSASNGVGAVSTLLPKHHLATRFLTL